MEKLNLLVVVLALTIIGSNAQSYTGVLTHTNGYLIIKPYSSSYDDGSYVKSFYDGNNRRLVYWNSAGGYTDMYFGSLFLNGELGIGKLTPTAKLHVNGNIIAEEIKVENVTGADFVFAKDYALMPLAETEAYIKQHRHLPEVPSATEMQVNGVELGKMNMLLLQKIEELTLLMIEQNKRIVELENRN